MSDASERTVAVFGALRSGTTLLRIMLHGHSKFECPGETDFLLDHLVQGLEGPKYNLDNLKRDRIYRAHEEKYARSPLVSFTPDAFLERIAIKDSVGVLMLHRHPDRLLDLYPNLRIIHMVRDPRDVARSSIGMGWAGTVYHGADHWIETERQWQAIAHRVTSEQVLVVRYEDIIRETEKTLSAICNFCGLTFEPEMLDYENRTTYSKPDVSLTEQWRTKQTADELSLTEFKLGTFLQKAGYAPSGHIPRAPTLTEHVGLVLKNKRSIWAHRIGRYGLRDPLLVSIGRKVKAPWMSKNAQRRIDEKIVSYLK